MEWTINQELDPKEGFSIRSVDLGLCNRSKYDMKILLGDFNAKVGRENILKADYREWESTSG